MRTNVHPTAQLGELVVVAFDKAAQYSTNSREVTRLATRAVMHMLRRARRISPSLTREDCRIPTEAPP